MMRRTASERVRNLKMRLARLERIAGAPWEKALFSVGGGTPETGAEILKANGGDEDVKDALLEAFKKGSWSGFNMEDIKLVKKASTKSIGINSVIEPFILKGLQASLRNFDLDLSKQYTWKEVITLYPQYEKNIMGWFRDAKKRSLR